MDEEFWHNKWKTNNIGFHNDSVHPLLAKHWNTLNRAGVSRVFVPLCGKTVDIAWLLSQGHQVVGAELSELAIQQLFNDLNVEPNITNMGSLIHYHSENIDIYVGDIFELSYALVGEIDAIYDRAALVALPFDLRKRYSAHLQVITDAAPQLLICFEYDQQHIDGPPFSIAQHELTQHYVDNYSVNFIEGVPVEGGLKGKVTATETVWLLHKKLDEY